MEEHVTQLKQQVASLLKENERFKKMMMDKKIDEEISNKVSIIDYHTDEDELVRETDWIIKEKKNSKKRKAETSPEIMVVKSSEGTRGRMFEAQKGNSQEDPKANTRKEAPPPPINVVGIEKYAEVKALLASDIISNKEYKIVAQNNNVWKILMPDPNSYRAMTGKLNAEKKQWYTYEDKNRRPIKVMARGLHSSCEKQDIIDDLQQKGLKIIDAVNIIKKEKRDNSGFQELSRKGLPLFMLTFDHEETAEKIYNIKTILNMRVKIEPLRKTTNLIPQCKRCQGYNHTQKYCYREPRCVKCLGKHFTRDCLLKRSEQPTCVNCKEHHPANYRGCEVAKQLQRLRYKKGNDYKQRINTQMMEVSERPPSLPIEPKSSYAKVVQQQQKNVMEQETALDEVLKRLNDVNKLFQEQKETNEKILDKLVEQQKENVKLSERISKIDMQMKRLNLKVKK